MQISGLSQAASFGQLSKNDGRLRSEVKGYVNSGYLSSTEEKQLPFLLDTLDALTPNHEVSGTLGSYDIPAQITFKPLNGKVKEGSLSQGLGEDINNDKLVSVSIPYGDEYCGRFPCPDVVDPVKFLTEAIKIIPTLIK